MPQNERLCFVEAQMAVLLVGDGRSWEVETYRSFHERDISQDELERLITARYTKFVTQEVIDAKRYSGKAVHGVVCLSLCKRGDATQDDIQFNWPVVDLPDTAWEPDGTGRMFAGIQICGAQMHLEAIPIHYSDDGYQEGSGESAEVFEMYAAAAGADGAMQTIKIRGEEYVLFVTPYCT